MHSERWVWTNVIMAIAFKWPFHHSDSIALNWFPWRMVALAGLLHCCAVRIKRISFTFILASANQNEWAPSTGTSSAVLKCERNHGRSKVAVSLVYISETALTRLIKIKRNATTTWFPNSTARSFSHSVALWLGRLKRVGERVSGATKPTLKAKIQNNLIDKQKRKFPRNKRAKRKKYKIWKNKAKYNNYTNAPSRALLLNSSICFVRLSG